MLQEALEVLKNKRQQVAGLGEPIIRMMAVIQSLKEEQESIEKLASNEQR